MFLVPKHIALRMVVKSNMSCKRSLTKLNFRLVLQDIRKKSKNCNVLGFKTHKNDPLTLISGLLSSLTGLSTCRTFKRG